MASNNKSSMPKGNGDTQGVTIAATKDSAVNGVWGTQHEDIISVRRDEGQTQYQCWRIR